MHRNKSVDTHQFAMVPRAEIPRASFKMERAYKTTFDSGFLVPVLCEEVLPGDTFKLRMTAFARLATPIFPIMDNLYLDSFFFFVPNRLVWENWQRFMGERNPDPDSSIDYVVPTIESPLNGYRVNSVYDYFGLPTVGQIAGDSQFEHSALPLRAYNLIYNEWFRDQNLIDSRQVPIDDGPDDPDLYEILKRGKRHDYFTSCLPWPNKNGVAVSLPLGGTAPVKGQFVTVNSVGGDANDMTTNNGTNQLNLTGLAVGTHTVFARGLAGDLYADLSAATAATINVMRQAFQIQRLLERDARGGTRYTEIIRAHFGVISPDARLQRPEYLGGGSTPVVINPIAQTSATDVTGSDSPLGNLAAVGTALASGHGFSQSFTEHGYIIGLVNVRADLTYQQGLRRHWSRQTRYDYYFPAFAMLGEQAVLNQEIYCDGTASDTEVFGYQERWAEYRYSPSEITGRFRSTSTAPLDAWHLAQDFVTLPTLGQSFISESPPVQRIVAVGSEAAGSEFLFDSVFTIIAARPMPLYSVPGLIDHF